MKRILLIAMNEERFEREKKFCAENSRSARADAS
jgi:hypothetical protein